MPDNRHIFVENQSLAPIEFFVTSESGSNGFDAWVTLEPNQTAECESSQWELVAFRRPGVDATRAGVYVPSGDVVIFNSFSDIQTASTSSAKKLLSIHYNGAPGEEINIQNNSSRTINVSASRAGDGNSGFFALQSGEKQRWRRDFWEVVVITNPDDPSQRTGAYLPRGTLVEFNGFDAHAQVQSSVFVAPHAHTLPDPKYITVENQSLAPVQVFVSSYSNKTGNDEWYILQPGQHRRWARTHWEVAGFKHPEADTIRAGAYVPNGDVVIFSSFTNIHTLSTPPANTFILTSRTTGVGSEITVENRSLKPVRVFVSKWSNSNGDDGWNALQPGAKATWPRNSWEAVVFESYSNSRQRTGVYVSKNSHIVFNGFDASDQQVSHTPHALHVETGLTIIENVPSTPIVHQGPADPGHVVVENNSSTSIELSILSHSSSHGHESWYTLQPGHRQQWKSSPWEVVAFGQPGQSTARAGIFVLNGDTITFSNFSNIRTGFTPAADKFTSTFFDAADSSSIVIENNSLKPIKAFISQWAKGVGNSQSSTLQPGSRQLWRGVLGDVVVIENPIDGSQRTGTFAAGGTRVVFNGFDATWRPIAATPLRVLTPMPSIIRPATATPLTKRVADPGHVLVENRSPAAIELSISSRSSIDGYESWYTLQPGQNNQWNCSHWDVVTFKQPGAETSRAGVHVLNGDAVTFNNFSSIHTTLTPPATKFVSTYYNAVDSSSIMVENKSLRPVNVFISQWHSGDRQLLTVQPGSSQMWQGVLGDVVVIENPHDGNQKTGIYVTGGTRIAFNGFDDSWRPFVPAPVIQPVAVTPLSKKLLDIKTSSPLLGANLRVATPSISIIRSPSVATPSMSIIRSPLVTTPMVSIIRSPSVAPPPKSMHVVVENKSPSPVELAISSHSSNKGHETWYILHPGQRNQWNCSNWEVVTFRQPGVSVTRAGIYVLNSDTITFHNFSNIQTAFTPPASKFISAYYNVVDSSSITIENNSLKTINAFYTQWASGNGNRQSLTIRPGSSQSWHEVFGGIVVVENPGDVNQRTGIHVSGGTRIVFNGFDTGLRLATPSVTPKKVYIENKSSAPIELAISSHSKSNGYEAWHILQPGQNNQWNCSHWEVVTFRQPGVNTTRAGIYVLNGDTITFHNFSNIQTSFTPPASKFISTYHNAVNSSSIMVENNSLKPVNAFISQWANVNRDHQSLTLQPGSSQLWEGVLGDVVVIENPNDASQRTGVFVLSGTRIAFNGFDSSWLLATPTISSPKKVQIVVENKSLSPVELAISSQSNSNGYESWHILQPGQRNQWNSSHWEVVTFRQPGVNSTRAGIYALNGDTISFHNFSNIQTSFTPPASKFVSTYHNVVDSSSVVIENSSLRTVNAFFTQYVNGNGIRQSLTVQPGSSQLWHGVLGEVVVIENPNDVNQKTGIYVSGGTRIVFNGFDASWKPVVPPPKKVQVFVENKSLSPVELAISSHSNNNGYETWYILHPGQKNQWDSSHWEVVTFRQPGVNSTRAGIYALNGDTISFHNFSNIQTAFTPPASKFVSTYHNVVDSSSVVIENSSLRAVNAFFTQYVNGSGVRQSLTVQPGSSQLWHGVLGEVVVIENPNDVNQKTGIYVSGGTRIVFNGFDASWRPVVPPPKKVQIFVENKSLSPIELAISSHSNNSGYETWYILHPGQKNQWNSSHWEVVTFRQPGVNSTRAGVYVLNDDTITFHNFSNIQTSFTPPASKFVSTYHNVVDSSSVVIENSSLKTVNAFFTQYVNGNGIRQSLTVQPGSSQLWHGVVGEVVVIENPNDVNQKTGIYVSGGTRIVFNGFDASWRPAITTARLQEAVVVENRSNRTIEVLVPQYANGKETQSWVTLKPGQIDAPLKFNKDLVAFREPGEDSTRVYVTHETRVIYNNTANIQTVRREL